MAIKSKEGAVAWYDLFFNLLPIIERVVKKLRENLIFIKLWRPGRKKYLYHIHDPLREIMRDYLKDENILKKFGFAFGNELRVEERFGGRKEIASDIGIYGFLPLYEIFSLYNTVEIDGKLVNDVCAEFLESVKEKKAGNIKKMVASAEQLLHFVLKNCCNEKFPKLILAPEHSPFAASYAKLLGDLKDLKKKSPKRWKVILKRFVKASLQGIYINSEGFKNLDLSIDPRDVEKNTKAIAESVGEGAVEVLGKVKKITFRGGGAASSTPDTPKNRIMELLGDRSVSVVLTNKLRLQMLIATDKIVERIMRKFDYEINERVRAIEARLPIIVNVYIDRAKELRSVCAAYDGAIKEMRQIKYSAYVSHGNPFERCENVKKIYDIGTKKALAADLD